MQIGPSKMNDMRFMPRVAEKPGAATQEYIDKIYTKSRAYPGQQTNHQVDYDYLPEAEKEDWGVKDRDINSRELVAGVLNDLGQELDNSDYETDVDEDVYSEDEAKNAALAELSAYRRKELEQEAVEDSYLDQADYEDGDFTQRMSSAAGEEDDQERFDKISITKTDKLVVNKVNQNIKRKNYNYNRRGLSTKKINYTDQFGVEREKVAASYSGPFPSKPQNKDIDRESLTALRKEQLDREIARFDNEPPAKPSDNLDKNYTVPEEDLHKMEKGV